MLRRMKGESRSTTVSSAAAADDAASDDDMLVGPRALSPMGDPFGAEDAQEVCA